eukprot:scaffold7391_cov198-Prasinococcus_capsulatus_cf.AAC.1
MCDGEPVSLVFTNCSDYMSTNSDKNGWSTPEINIGQVSTQQGQPVCVNIALVFTGSGMPVAHAIHLEIVADRTPAA